MASKEILSENEIDRLIQALLRSGPATETQIQRLLSWGVAARVGAELLRLALAGRIAPHVGKDGTDIEWTPLN